MKEPLLQLRCIYPVLVNLDDKFVFFIANKTEIPLSQRQYETRADYYDIANNTWTRGPIMTRPEPMMSVCALSGILYAFSG